MFICGNKVRERHAHMQGLQLWDLRPDIEQHLVQGQIVSSISGGDSDSLPA